MAVYKCINCGETKDSEQMCRCPICGYSMFLSPFDRRSILISEIKRYIDQLEKKTIKKNELILEGLDSAQNRFPKFSTLLDFVTKKEKTEDFLDSLKYAVEQSEAFFQNTFSAEIKVSFESVYHSIEDRENVLKTSLGVIGVECPDNVDPIVFSDCTLYYSEIQNKYLWFSAEELLKGINNLADKIVGIIRINNLYGATSRYQPKRIMLQTDKKGFDWKDVLEERIEIVSAILKKEYFIDIFDSGKEPLEEMLDCLWNSVEAIMLAPLLISEYQYVIDDRAYNESAFFNHLSEILMRRYERINALEKCEQILSGKGEEEILDIYREVVKTDKYGYLIPNGTKLMNPGESERKLNELIGLDGIKEAVTKIKTYALLNKDCGDLNLHMCFLGNPGSGKTEVARIIAGILYENRILPTNNLIEVDRSGLVSQYFGATAEKTSRVIASAMGGVLFIDEAYALGNNTEPGNADYGKEAIDTLVKAMEDYRGKFCVIFAGYKNEMLQMLSINPGLKSRIQFILDFPNYTRNEFKRIFELMLKQRDYSANDVAMRKMLEITDIKRKEPNFANAREARNILDQVVMCQNLRCAGTDDKEIGVVDVNKYIQDAKIRLPLSGIGYEAGIMTGEEELDHLVGLDNVKRIVRKIKAYAKRNKGESDFNLHMCFLGNPGTGKTEVARILSRILYDAGALGEAKLVETDAHGLIGKYAGQTAPKAEGKINEAMNGVLFIDEAYRLADADSFSDGSVGYGEDAIAVLLKEMENRRGQFCVILAGYRNEMKKMISTNPGLESRIQFAIDFPDYSRPELGEIALKFVQKKKYSIDDPAMERILDITEYFRKRPNFANARTVRNIIDQVIMNQNLRTENSENDDRIILADVDEYVIDEGIDLSAPTQERRIGF